MAEHHQHNFEYAWKSAESGFLETLLGIQSFGRFRDYLKKTAPEIAYQKLIESNIEFIPIYSSTYPKLLKKIHDPPYAFYARGNFRTLFPLAMVGSRKATPYGLQAVSAIITGLAGLPISTISGLAYGIDAHVHLESIRAGLHTVAVLGSGIDTPTIYPRFHRGLAQNILAAGGGIISEFPPGTEALPYHFPLRNRIISGLSKATLLFEAGIKSGALITAENALEQNRDIFALPGNIFSNTSKGANALIASGAIPLLSAQTIIDTYPPLQKILKQKRIHQGTTRAQQNFSGHIPDTSLSREERLVFKYIHAVCPDTDALYKCPGLQPPEILSALTSLEIKNKIHFDGTIWKTVNLTNPDNDR
jgi:DNA processing protein